MNNKHPSLFKKLTRGINIQIGKPLESDLIVIDGVNYEYLKKILPKDYSVTIIKQRPQVFFISFEVIYKLILIFLKKRLKHISIKKRLKQSYYESLILTLNPKAVVTLIDNNQTFNYLSKKIKSIPFIAVQNGLRHPFEGSANSFHVQHYFSFGQNEKTYYSNYNMEVENYYPSGSLLNSIFSKKNTKKEDKEYDILIVSCWRGNIGYSKDVEDSMESMRIADNLMSKYLSNRNLKAAIILRSERNGDHWFMPEVGLTEEQYFKSIYKKDVKIIDVDFKKRNIYELINKSDLILSGFGTTTLLEAYGSGKKILYTIFCDDNKYHEIFDSSILCTNSEWKYFKNRLDEIISIDNGRYLSDHKKNMNFYMSQPKKGTLKYIKNKLNEIILNNSKN